MTELEGERGRARARSRGGGAARRRAGARAQVRRPGAADPRAPCGALRRRAARRGPAHGPADDRLDRGRPGRHPGRVLHRLLVYRVHQQSPVAALVNPEIEWFGDELETLEEGCLSRPVHVDVERPVHICVRALNEYGEPLHDRGLRPGGPRHPARDRPPRRGARARPDLALAAQGSDAGAARGAAVGLSRAGRPRLRTVYLGTSEFAAHVLRVLAGSPHRPSWSSPARTGPAAGGAGWPRRRSPKPPASWGSTWTSRSRSTMGPPASGSPPRRPTRSACARSAR